jgi:hypothetical protein
MAYYDNHRGVADGRPGLRYLRTVALPAVSEDGVPASGAAASWIDATGSTFAQAVFELVPSDPSAGFGSIVEGYDLALGAMRARTSTVQDISGTVKSAIVWHSLDGHGESVHEVPIFGDDGALRDDKTIRVYNSEDGSVLGR